MKRFFSHIAKRIAPMALLSAILVAAILYQNGVYEIAFITRSDNYDGQQQTGTDTPSTPIFSDGAVENTDAPLVSDSVLDELNGSSNISSDSSSADSETRRPELDMSGKYESFGKLSDYTSQNFSISYKDYTSSSVLAEITLDGSLLPSNLYGGNRIYVKFTSAVDKEDGIPYSVREFDSDTSMAVELYMGYIIIDNGETLSLFSGEGAQLGSFDRMYFTPAYTRDSENNALFYLTQQGSEDFYRFDTASRNFVLADYDDELDNRGLYFDYTPDYGLSDNEYNRYNAIVNCIVEMTHEQAFDYTAPNTAPPITEPAPDTTAPETETSAPETETSAPETETSAPETETSAPETETSAPETETSAPETETSAPETETSSPETETSSSETDTSAEDTSTQTLLRRLPRTEILFASDTVMELLNAAPSGSTTTNYSNYTLSEDGKTVFVELMERRWAFDVADYMQSQEYLSAPDDKKLSEHYKYYRLYNFTDGLCATVARDGVLSFRDTAGNEIISRDTEYFGQNNRKLLTSYAEPLLKGIDSIGSLYFDDGLVMIRQIDIDSQFTDKLSGDYSYLVDKNGKKFSIPAGYELIAYSDGVLLLEKDGYYGYYSNEGKWIAQPIFTYARPFAQGLGVIGFSGSKKGVVDTQGNLIIPFKYDYISQVSSGIIALYGDEGWKLIAKMDK